MGAGAERREQMGAGEEQGKSGEAEGERGATTDAVSTRFTQIVLLLPAQF
jgi:hypothetical protein